MNKSSPSPFERDTLLAGPSFQAHLYADSHVLPNLPAETTLSSQEDLFVGFDQSWFSQAEPEYVMPISSTPAVISIDSVGGLQEGLQGVFNAGVEASVAEELVCYGMVSLNRLLDRFLIFKKSVYLQLHSFTMRRSSLWDRAKSYRKGYKISGMAARTFPEAKPSESNHQLNYSCSSNLPITGIWDTSVRRWSAG